MEKRQFIQLVCISKDTKIIYSENYVPTLSYQPGAFPSHMVYCPFMDRLHNKHGVLRIYVHYVKVVFIGLPA